MKVTEQICKDFRSAIDPVLKNMGARAGMDIKLGNISYDSDGFTAKITAKVLGENGESAEYVQWQKNAVAYGLRQEWFGCQFSMEGKTYKIKGINTSARKNVVLIEDTQGRTYSTSVHTIVRAMGSMI